MSLTNTTAENEQNILKSLVEKLRDALSITTVFDRKIFINSQGDFVEKFSQKPADKKEIRFALLEFLGYDDDQTEGDDDCPVCVLIYRLTIFFAFVDKRANGSNSAREFTAAILAARKDFLESRDLLDADGIKTGGVCLPLERETFADVSANNIAGQNGHEIKFLLKVKHYGK